MPTVSSATPEALARYARATRGSSARLEVDARRLEAALMRFAARCTEYRVPQADGLSGRMFLATRRLDELGAWVEGVAAAFEHADTGQVGAPAVAPSAPAPPVAAPAAPAILLQAVQAIMRYHGKPSLVVTGLATTFVGRAWDEFGDEATTLAAELTGIAELRRGFDALSAAMAGGLSTLGAVEARWGADAALLLIFEALWVRVPTLPGGQLVFDPRSQEVAWNMIALSLAGQLTAAEGAIRLTGPTWPLAVPTVVATLGPSLVGCGIGALALSVVGDAPHWAFQPIGEPGDALDLVERSFWNQSFQRADPLVLRMVAVRVDALNQLLSGGPSAGGAAPASPEVGVDLHDATVSGAYAAISYEAGEQVVLERLNAEGEYRLSIAGLDPTKPGAPNNFTSVVDTADFSPEQNRYYQHVRRRFFEALRQIPPGSELHLQGHSMGGGVLLLLRHDPEVQRRLRELRITVPSLIIYGAVVPTQAQFDPVLPEDNPFFGAELRAFVHNSDSLALNVGAGYDGYPDVQMIGGSVVAAPAHAHNDYANPVNYEGVPGELTALPYVIDPNAYERSVPGLPLVEIEPIESPPILAGA